MSLTVKAYLKSNDDTEIRRFSVDEGVTSSYEYLSKKIVQVFPKLENPNHLRVSYKDSEGDLVTFSSDEELIEGLGQIQEDIFRVYIRETKRGQSKPCGGEEEPAHHFGVVCDGCEGQIRGPRFKCMTCADYDLCKKCKKSGVHTEHEFHKIPRPAGRPQFFGAGQWHPGMARFPPFGGPFGCHPGMRRFQKEMHRQQQQQQQQQEGADVKPNEKAEEMNQDAKVANEFLQKMGESVAMMLDPFGIDVDIDVEHGGVRQKCPGGRRCGPGGNGRKGKGQGKQGGKGKKGNKDEESTPGASNEDKPMEADTSEKSGADTKEVPEGMETDGAKPHSSDNEWTMVQDDAPEGEGAVDGRKDPRYAQALAQMTAMGFDDEGGWLSQLLKAKNFDIGRVLDAIKLGQPRVGGGNY